MDATTKARLAVALVVVFSVALGATPVLARQTPTSATSPTAATPPQQPDKPATPPRPAARRLPVRSAASAEFGGQKVTIAYGLPEATGREFQEMEGLPVGGTVRFFDSAATKLSTPIDLMIGNVRLKKGNVAPEYPGVYALWLRKSAAGWNLAFTKRADVWGTQFAEADLVAETALEHRTGEASAEHFVVEIGEGRLTLSWGPHIWSTAIAPAP